MQETNYPSPFRASDANFLRWSVLAEDRRKQLLADFAEATEDEFAVQANDITVQQAPLSFYRDLTLAAFSVPGVDQDRFFLCQGNELLPSHQLLSTNEPIYEANETFGMVLTQRTVLDYCRFFFHFVRGVLGAFHIVEAVDDIAWRPKARAATKAKAAALLMPLVHCGLDADGLFHNTGTVIFKNALFKTDILVASRPLADISPVADEPPQDFSLGQSALANEDLLLEDLPVVE